MSVTQTATWRFGDTVIPDVPPAEPLVPLLPLQIAICAKAHNKPFYVAAESYKFARLYPLNQQDLPVELKPLDVTPLLPPKVG